MLGWADRSGDQNSKSIESLTWRQTLMIGGAQALALRYHDDRLTQFRV